MKHFTSSVLLSTTTAISSLLFLSLLQNQNVQAADNLARDKCRELHHAEADASSAYSNNNCLLHCVIPKGGAAPAPTSAADHFMNEGFPCPLAEAGVCRGGQCVPRRAVLPGLKLGSLEIELLAATFPAAANLKTPYINVCLMNSTNHQPVSTVKEIEIEIGDVNKQNFSTYPFAPAAAPPEHRHLQRPLQGQLRQQRPWRVPMGHRP